MKRDEMNLSLMRAYNEKKRKDLLADIEKRDTETKKLMLEVMKLRSPSARISAQQ
jgi:hypothetical protein